MALFTVLGVSYIVQYHSHTHEEQRSAAKLMKRISPEKGVLQLPAGGTVKRI